MCSIKSEIHAVRTMAPDSGILTEQWLDETSRAEEFPRLYSVLSDHPRFGVAFAGVKAMGFRASHSQPPLLKHYYAEGVIQSIIENNLRWARGEAEQLQFQFAYLMLPTPCNLKCRGCFMGKDKGRLPSHLSGPYYSEHEIHGILSFLVEHGAKAVAYAGGGELFAWNGAMDLVETIHSYGLRFVTFTNGTLLSRDDIGRLNDLGAVLMVSLRDTAEALHNAFVGCDAFRRTLSTIDAALEEGFHLDNRLAVEIPATKANTERILSDFVPAMRALGIIPMVEEFIQISTSDDERTSCHDFAQARDFFERLSQIDARHGIVWQPEFGQRMMAQPKCRRPLYSFAVFPSGGVMDCPSHSVRYGNFKEQPLRDIFHSEGFRLALRRFDICACSVFYTKHDEEIPEVLPEYLEALRCSSSSCSPPVREA